MPEPATTTANAAIIRAQGIEKYYAQPSQNRIQVIAPTDLSIVPGEILALLVRTNESVGFKRTTPTAAGASFVKEATDILARG